MEKMKVYIKVTGKMVVYLPKVITKMVRKRVFGYIIAKMEVYGRRGQEPTKTERRLVIKQ
jgi:hypothetical protein